MGKLWGVMAFFNAVASCLPNLMLMLTYKLGGFFVLDVGHLLLLLLLCYLPVLLYYRLVPDTLEEAENSVVAPDASFVQPDEEDEGVPLKEHNRHLSR